MVCPKVLLNIVFLTTVLLFSACSDGEDEPEIVASENIFINEIYASGDDWIELYNATDEVKNISGYKIYDEPLSKYTLPAGTSVPPRGFLIILCNDANTGLQTNFKLSSAGETVYLENTQGEVVDKVTFPALVNNQSYARFPDGSLILKITGNPTQAGLNGNASAPTITQVTRLPLIPAAANTVQVKASIQPGTPVASVRLFYRMNSTGAFSSLNMTNTAAEWVATIPALNNTGRVDYYVQATANAEVSVTSPPSAPDKLHFYVINTDPLPQLVINEFMAANVSCCPDNSSGTNEHDDWIEVYNAGTTPVNIAGYYFSDDTSNPFNSRIPDTNPSATTIQPGGYLRVWADGQRDQGPLHVDFALNSAGEAVGLYYLDGRTIDQFTFGPQSDNVSVGRNPNGTGPFQVLSSSSPGQPNN